MWFMVLSAVFISLYSGTTTATPPPIYKIIFSGLESTTTQAPKHLGCRCQSIESCPPNTGVDLRIVNQGTSASCPLGEVWCCQQVIPSSCGRRKFTNELEPPPGTARYGNHSWQVAILMPDDTYFGSGVLINANHVLTVAHKVSPYPNFKFKLRLGDWDLKTATEPFRPQDYNPVRVFTHPNYNPQNLSNDIAVVRLDKKVPLETSPHINTACLPTSAPVPGSRCYVAGWGTNAFGSSGMYQSILKEVDVPIIDETSCETRLRATRLGPYFNLDRSSFMCAGGEPGKDSCTGDGGAPLVCSTKDYQWYVVGLVDWGIGCANSTVPGVYINVHKYLSWINQQLAVK